MKYFIFVLSFILLLTRGHASVAPLTVPSEDWDFDSDVTFPQGVETANCRRDRIEQIGKMTVYAVNKCIQSVYEKPQADVWILSGAKVRVGCTAGVAIEWENLDPPSNKSEPMIFKKIAGAAVRARMKCCTDVFCNSLTQHAKNHTLVDQWYSRDNFNLSITANSSCGYQDDGPVFNAAYVLTGQEKNMTFRRKR